MNKNHSFYFLIYTLNQDQISEYSIIYTFALNKTFFVQLKDKFCTENFALNFYFSLLVGSNDMTVLIAAGPFSTSDNLSFEPLADLVKHIRKDKPDVVILVLSVYACNSSKIY